MRDKPHDSIIRMQILFYWGFCIGKILVPICNANMDLSPDRISLLVSRLLILLSCTIQIFFFFFLFFFSFFQMFWKRKVQEKQTSSFVTFIHSILFSFQLTHVRFFSRYRVKKNDEKKVRNRYNILR